MGNVSQQSSSHPPDSQKDGIVIGVDIGGTKIAAGIVDGKGRILNQTRTPMIAHDGAESGLAAVVCAISSVSAEVIAHQTSIRAIGICSPGPLNPAEGIIVNPPNLPCWRNFPITAEVAKIHRVPVMLDNDANAAALAEVLWGAGRGYRNVFYVTIGTGIGTGIVFDNRIYHGRTGAAGEGGHMSIDYNGPRCGCGKPGCIEALAAGPAIAKRARHKLKENPGCQSLMRELAGGDGSNVTSEIVSKAYAAGDYLAKEVLKETVDLLSRWLGNVIDLLDPEVIIIGGGVAEMLSSFFEAIRAQLPSCCVNSRCQEIPLLMAHYGSQAGIAGAAALCWASEKSVVR